MNDGKESGKEMGVLFDDAMQKTDQLHQGLAGAANLAGYMRDSLSKNSSYWVRLAESSTGDPELETVAASGIDFMRALNNKLDQLNASFGDFQRGVTMIASTAATFDSNTAVLSASIPVQEVGEVKHTPCPFLQEQDEQSVAERLKKLDPAITKTYIEIWEALYGTVSEPERAALYLMRQTYDHFFSVLAADDKVRNSDFWKPKEGDKPDLVTRQERIEYAAFAHVKDKDRGQMIASEAKNILTAYNRLNQAHKRGELDPVKAKDAVMAMNRIIVDWLDAIET